jgi:hypothetical protein
MGAMRGSLVVGQKLSLLWAGVLFFSFFFFFFFFFFSASGSSSRCEALGKAGTAPDALRNVTPKPES